MTAFYRTYRPRTVSQLDNTHAQSALTAIIASGRVAHAYLFTGPRGTGKTTTARILAKAVNCTYRKNPIQDPCDTCDSCTSITHGFCTDVLEIDAASNRGIDDIRELRQRIALAPVQVRRKVYIIDEVHMLTAEAFNALLKTLEEPPSHALLILCTTEVQKIPQTIVSRCQEILFESASAKELLSALTRIVKAEKLAIEGKVLETIGEASDGSFRDAVKYLEQLVTMSDHPSSADLAKVRRTATLSDRVLFLSALTRGDSVRAIECIEQWEQEGADFVNLLSDILSDVRVCFLIKQGVKLTLRDKDRIQTTEGITNNLSLVQITALLKALIGCFEYIRTVPYPAAVLELMVGEWAVKYARTEPVSIEEDSPPTSPETSRGRDDSSKREKENVKEITFTAVKDDWHTFANAVKEHNQTLGTILVQAKPCELTGSTLTLEVLYSFHRDRLTHASTRKILERVGSEVFGTPLALTCTIAARPMRKADVANVNIPATDAEVLQAVAEIFGGEAVKSV